MLKYIGKRLIQILITLFLFQAATYFLMDAQPGDIAQLLTLNPDIPPAEQDRLRAELGLDRPPVERFFTYVGNFYRGDLGVSFTHYPRPVSDILIERLPRTLVLFFSAVIVYFWLGFTVGKFLAWRRGGFVEYGATVAGVTLFTVFYPFFALMMIWLFSVWLGWLPAGKFLDPIEWLGAEATGNEIFNSMIYSALIAGSIIFAVLYFSNKVEHRWRVPVRAIGIVAPIVFVILYWWTSGVGYLAWDILTHMILPILTITLIAFGGTMLLTRTSMLETLREDYILTARAKGVPDKSIRDKHAARNALLPVWTSLVFAIGSTVSGGIITETVFSWPGIGLTLLNATTAEDIPLAMGALTIIGVLTLFSHLAADVGYALLDPRIRYS